MREVPFQERGGCAVTAAWHSSHSVPFVCEVIKPCTLPLAQELRVLVPNHGAFSIFWKVVTQEHNCLFAMSNKLIGVVVLTTAYFQSLFFIGVN